MQEPFVRTPSSSSSNNAHLQVPVCVATHCQLAQPAACMQARRGSRVGHPLTTAGRALACRCLQVTATPLGAMAWNAGMKLLWLPFRFDDDKLKQQGYVGLDHMAPLQRGWHRVFLQPGDVDADNQYGLLAARSGDASGGRRSRRRDSVPMQLFTRVEALRRRKQQGLLVVDTCNPWVDARDNSRDRALHLQERFPNW